MPIRDLPDAIQWHEGMLLAPQHFQQLSLRSDALLHHHIRAVAPFHWGVHRFEIDPVLLVHGTFRVIELEGVMPDGLVVSVGSDDPASLEIDLNPYAEEMKEREHTIHLVVPARRNGAAFNVDLGRYDSVESDPVVDENTGEGELRIPRLKPKLSLLVSEAPPAKYVSFPLARVVYRNEMFSTVDFIPPTLSVPLQSRLGETCRQITRRLRDKAQYLSEEVRQRAHIMGRDAVQDYKSWIRCLVDSLPFAESVLHTGMSHPYLLYLSLTSIVGRTATLGSSMIPPLLSPYNHNDLLKTFEQVRVFILKMVDETISERYFWVPFDFQQGVFSIRFDESWMERDLLLGVRGVPEREVLAWMQECLIGSEAKIQSLRERRILGVERIKREEEDAFASARGITMFSLHNDAEFIIPGQMLQVLEGSSREGTTAPMEVLLFINKERMQEEENS
jgi:type VI secretion system protein ImpJ